jgi:hypothetical protein
LAILLFANPFACIFCSSLFTKCFRFCDSYKGIFKVFFIFLAGSILKWLWFHNTLVVFVFLIKNELTSCFLFYFKPFVCAYFLCFFLDRTFFQRNLWKGGHWNCW